MTDFDFAALEEQMHDTSYELRDRALAAWADERVAIERDFLVRTTNRLEEVLGVSNGENPVVAVVNVHGKGSVEVTVDGVRFKVEFHPQASNEPEAPPMLFARMKTLMFTPVTSLAELGEKIANGTIIPE